jgi:hypothetical protein
MDGGEAEARASVNQVAWAWRVVEDAWSVRRAAVAILVDLLLTSFWRSHVSFAHEPFVPLPCVSGASLMISLTGPAVRILVQLPLLEVGLRHCRPTQEHQPHGECQLFHDCSPFSLHRWLHGSWATPVFSQLPPRDIAGCRTVMRTG